MTRIRRLRLAAKRPWTKLWLSPVRLLVAAAIFHLAVTTTIFGLGRYELLPGTFDTNGIVVSSDGIKYRAEVASLSEVLTRGQIRDWLTAAYPFHLKLHSICFALFGPWLGFTIISAEPLNALCYLVILVLIFNLGLEAFNRRAGLLAAATVALWPSFLLHTTQLLKDPLFVAGMLAFILVNLRLLSRSFSWPQALLAAAGGGLLAIFIWLARDSMGALMIAIVVLAAGMLMVRQLRERRFLAPNLVGMVLLMVIAVSVTSVVPTFRKPDASPASVKTGIKEDALSSGGVGIPAASKAPPTSSWWNIAARVGTARRRFIRGYPDAGSNIDRDVQLTSIGELIRYVPRAAAIGFYAPFPNMWFAEGKQVGSSGRLLSGLETLAIYAIEGLAIVGLWRGRRRLSVWLLLSVAATGMGALGLVVVNVGALYRLRYTFLILIIILAAEGAAHSVDWFRAPRADAPPGAGTDDRPTPNTPQYNPMVEFIRL